jgi:hypothetical protein
MDRVRIEYFDQNESFREVLPKSGTIVGRFGEASGTQDWALVRLDEPFDWQLKVGTARFAAEREAFRCGRQNS